MQKYRYTSFTRKIIAFYIVLIIAKHFVWFDVRFIYVEDWGDHDVYLIIAHRDNF